MSSADAAAADVAAGRRRLELAVSWRRRARAAAFLAIDDLGRLVDRGASPAAMAAAATVADHTWRELESARAAVMAAFRAWRAAERRAWRLLN